MRALKTYAAIISMVAAGMAQAAPQYLDLGKAVNSNFEDDGVADNGKGGWTDEGINDMIIYPQLKFGENVRNGYKFKLIDPAANGGNAVMILKGADRCKDKPQEIAVKVPSYKAKYLYIVQNAASQAKGEQKGYVVAVYTVKYEDGTSVDIENHDGVEIRQWWTGSWWDNSERKSWPVYMGRNFYTMKYSQFIGLWAMQWENPNPGKAITEIVFKSTGKAVPIIWAVTFDDEDYFTNPNIKADFVRPDGPPSDFFDKRIAQEQERLFTEMKVAGMVKGVRRAELIRPDLVAITVDAVVAGGAGQGEAKAAALQKEENFTVKSSDGKDADFANGVNPVKVGRHTFKYDTVNVGAFPGNNLYWHTYYLKLAKALKPGGKYMVSIKGIPAEFAGSMELDCSENAVTPVIKVNQGAYSSKASKRYAYLGWWAADLGPQEYSEFKKFSLVDDKSGAEVFSGEIKLRKASGDPAKENKFKEENISGENVYELDFSAFNKTGRYRIRIPGFASSSAFGIGGDDMKNCYYTTMRGFLVQRCGCELTKDVTDYPRPACHLKNYESGHLVYGVNEKYVDGKPVVQNRPLKDGEPVKEFRGGYHDAGDYDVFYSHMMANSMTMIAFEFQPDVFKDGDLKLPESGNGIPDILDEAEWGMKFYADTQDADGGVYAGRGNDEDYIGKEWKNEFNKWKEISPDLKKYGDYPPYGNFFPSAGSSFTFAAVASQFARCVKKYDAKKSEQYLAKAKKAYEWAEKHQAEGYEKEGISYGRVELKKGWIWAASELFKTTGEKKYGDEVVRLADKKEDAFKSSWNQVNSVPFFKWAYASTDNPNVDKQLQKTLADSIRKSADDIAKNCEAHAYRMGNGRDSGGWGNNEGGGYYAYICLMAYMLGGDQKHLDAACVNADYQLGANPLSRSFITGIGARPPEHPELRGPLYSEKGPAPGISVYGPGGDSKSLGGAYPVEVPLWRCWLDNRVAAMHSEFTVGSSIGESGILYAILWAMENRK